MVVQSTRRAAKSRIREMWQAELDEHGVVDMVVGGERICATLMRDPSFLVSFAADFLPDVVDEVGGYMFKDRRTLFQVGRKMSTPQAIRESVRQEIEEEMDGGQSAAARWIERVPSAGKLIPLLDMTKEQVVEASRTRIERGQLEMVKGIWFERIAQKMKSGQIVRKAWKEADIEALADKVKKEVTGSSDTIATAAD